MEVWNAFKVGTKMMKPSVENIFTLNMTMEGRNINLFSVNITSIIGLQGLIFKINKLWL